MRARLRLLKCDPTRRVAEHEPKVYVNHTAERVDQNVAVVPVLEQQHVLRGGSTISRRLLCTISAIIMHDLGEHLHDGVRSS